MASDATEEVLRARLRELIAATPDVGYRALHAALQAEEQFKGVGLKRVQKLLRELKGTDLEATVVPVAPQTASVQQTTAPNEAAASDGQKTVDERIFETTIARPDVEQKFGMMIDTERSVLGGHAITEIREGGVVHERNTSNPGAPIRIKDVLMSVNGKTTFDGMMDEFRQSLTCTLKLLRCSAAEGAAKMQEDPSEAESEAAKWKQRKARVTAALIPGLKKIIEKEFGPGASGRIGRVEDMYLRVGRDEVFEEDGTLGRRYAPGYIEGLSPVRPFHSTEDHPWCSDLKRHWKEIRAELRKSLDEKLWTPGAYQSSNEAYGKDWKILGVLTADQYRDPVRFKVTTDVIQKLKGIVPSEVFFARMPAHTKIAPHSDNLNYILTSHLALELEEGACSIRAGNEEREWKEGEMVMIDTTFIHSTKNESDRPRYILVLRFWHPGLTEEERRAIHLSHAILSGASGKRS
mmetsp:Transcript_57885/g.161558  ORF Transcript_57885/g.161558 Transcript_57885/m.161558 type:complete len:464 (+) Transcript_57885:70-1461(+)